MDVYVVTAGDDYEAMQYMAVWSSRELADEDVKSRKESNGPCYDWYEIDVITVDER